MKALLLYSHVSGHKDFTSKIAFVKRELASVFSTLDVFCTASKEEATRKEIEAAPFYDVFLVVGGDGTFNHTVNVLMGLEKRPILGYLNFGTLGDVGRNFGVTRSLKHSLSIIKKGHIVPFDVGEIGGSYFAYCAAIGSFSDIAYATPRHKKRSVGRLAYYLKAVDEAVKPTQIGYKIVIDGQKYSGKTPFVMILNGSHIGGFPVNRRSSISDGKMEVFLVAPGLFNGLVHYFFHFRVEKLVASEISLHVESDQPWCLDGEKGPSCQSLIRCVSRPLQIYSGK